MDVFFGLRMHNGWAAGRRAQRGALLILVLAVLFIISLLGIVFLTFQGIEQLVAKSYSDDVRAGFLAQAGLQHALAQLGEPGGSDPSLWNPGQVVQYDTLGGLHRPTLNDEMTYFGVTGAVPTPDLPLDWAGRPSFRVLDATQTPLGPYKVEPLSGAFATQYETQVGVPDTGLRGASGVMNLGKYGPRTEVYALKVRDESSLINANDGVEFGLNHALSQNLRRILNKLGQVLSPPITTLGDRVVNNRPSSGYANAVQLRDTLVSAGLTTDQANRAASFLTVYSWKDSAVANPVPLSGAVGTAVGATPSSPSADPANYPNAFYAVRYVRPIYNTGVTPFVNAPVYRLGYDRDYDDHPNFAIPGKPDLRFYDPALASGTPFHNGIYDHRSVHPLWIEVVKRAPVNVNTAGRETLVALLHGLQGFFTSIERRRMRPLTSTSGSGPSNYSWARERANYEQGGAYHTLASTNDGDECGFIYTTMRYWDEFDVDYDANTMIGARLIADEMIACRRRFVCTTIHSANGTFVPVGHPVTDYSGSGSPPPVPFAGPFRTWAQFQAFVDHLVNYGVIREKRPSWFQDYNQNGTLKSEVNGSAVQIRIASEAMGDVLKANFNPNLHLNELNPNRNLYLHVDKTDLLVNSTEFCFLPINGTYTVESIGRVLAPPDGSPPSDPFAGGLAFQVAAEKKLRATFQLWYGAVRHTTQPQFYAGTFAPRNISGPPTNNNFSVETGPEVDNGPITSLGFDTQTRWDGYIQLPTYGGNRHDTLTKPKNEYRATMSDAALGVYPGIVETGRAQHIGEKMHAHFAYDGSLHYHRTEADAGVTNGKVNVLPIGPWGITLNVSPAGLTDVGDKGCVSRGINLKCRSEDYAGGYFPPDYVYVSPQHRYRSARSFTIGNPEGPATGWVQTNAYNFPIAYHAPNDLRVDGIYLQRASSQGYFQIDWEAWQNSPGNATNIGKSAFRFLEGTASFWIKPNWFPECTGKPRVLFSAARPRYHIRTRSSGNTWYWEGGFDHNASGEYECNDPTFLNPSPFTLYYLPSMGGANWNSGSVPSADQSDGSNATYTGGIGRFRPASLGFGVGLGRMTGFNWDLRGIRKNWPAGFTEWACDADRLYGPNPWHPFSHDVGPAKNNYGTFANYHANVVTPCLNHEDHGNPFNYDPVRGPDGGFNYLRGHEWTFVTVNWRFPFGSGGPQPTDMQLLVNNQAVPNTTGLVSQPYAADGVTIGGTPYGGTSMKSWIPWWWISPWFWDISGNFYLQNTVVYLGGETDWIANFRGIDFTGGSRNRRDITAGYSMSRNWQADATFDEFYLWTDRSASSPGGMYGSQWLWTRGRYYRANDALATDATFTSAPITLPAAGAVNRSLPPFNAAPPYGSTMEGIATPPTDGMRVLGISWTAYGEAVNPSDPSAYSPHAGAVGQVMIPYMRDWSMAPTSGGPATVAMIATPDPNQFLAVSLVDMYLVNPATGAPLAGPFRNEHFSRTTVPFAAGQQFAYRVKLKVGPIDPLNSILLSTPVVDDVTFYYSLGGLQFLTIYWEPSVY